MKKSDHELFSNVDARCILDFTKESGFYQAILTFYSTQCFFSNTILRIYYLVHLMLIYRSGFNLYWHRIAYFVLMVPLRIYSLIRRLCEPMHACLL